MSLIINIRGTNGSGKSTLVSHYIDPTRQEVLLEFENNRGKMGRVVGNTNDSSNSPLYTDWPIEICTVGHYSNLTYSGGMDRISTQRHMKEGVRSAVQQHDVVFAEGIIAGTTYKPWLEFSQMMQAEGHTFVWAFLDTPIETCLERVQHRNGGKPVKSDQITAKYKTINGIRDKLKFTGEKVEIVDHTAPEKSMGTIIRKYLPR